MIGGPTLRAFAIGGVAILVALGAALVGGSLWPRVERVERRVVAPAVEAVSRVYRTGRILEAEPMLAINVLLDRPAEEWDRSLATLAARLGALRHIDAMPEHALSAKLTLTCERGTAQGSLVLTGEQKPRIQTLTLEIAKGA